MIKNQLQYYKYVLLLQCILISKRVMDNLTNNNFTNTLTFVVSISSLIAIEVRNQSYRSRRGKPLSFYNKVLGFKF
jgi:hypothetical protein